MKKEVSNVKIWTLMENTACDDRFLAEHGLSLYIEVGNQKILFDAGQTDAFADNAEKLGIDLSKVDFAVLSHGHYDHSGGLLRFLEMNDHAKVYVSEHVFGDYYNASGRYIGLEEKLKGSDRLIPVDHCQTIAPGITLLPGWDYAPRIPIDHAGLQKMKEGSLVPDDFLHEQYLLLEEKGERVLLSGCSHRGIFNILQWIPCDVLIGGFHFSKLEPEGEALQRAARALLTEKAICYTCHCTGTEQYKAMKHILGDKLHYLAAGSVLEL